MGCLRREAGAAADAAQGEQGLALPLQDGVLMDAAPCCQLPARERPRKGKAEFTMCPAADNRQQQQAKQTDGAEFRGEGGKFGVGHGLKGLDGLQGVNDGFHRRGHQHGGKGGKNEEAEQSQAQCFDFLFHAAMNL